MNFSIEIPEKFHLHTVKCVSPFVKNWVCRKLHLIF